MIRTRYVLHIYLSEITLESSLRNGKERLREPHFNAFAMGLISRISFYALILLPVLKWIFFSCMHASWLIWGSKGNSSYKQDGRDYSLQSAICQWETAEPLLVKGGTALYYSVGDIWPKFKWTELARIRKKVLKSEGFNSLVQDCTDSGIPVSLQIDWFSSKRGHCAKLMCGGGRVPIVTCKYCGWLLPSAFVEHVDAFVERGIKSYSWVSTYESACDEPLLLSWKSKSFPGFTAGKLDKLVEKLWTAALGQVSNRRGWRLTNPLADGGPSVFDGFACRRGAGGAVALLCSWQEWIRASARSQPQQLNVRNSCSEFAKLMVWHRASSDLPFCCPPF